MKKKILLGALIAIAVMCLFAISISATEIDGVHYSLNDNALTAEVSRDNQTATTAIVTIPSTVEYGGKTYKVNSIKHGAFESNTSIKELRILSEHITTIPNGMIANTYTNTEFTKIYVDFSKITQINQAGFNPSNETNGNSPRENPFYFYDAKAFLADGSDVVVECPDFSNCTSIAMAAFQGAKFKKVIIPDGCALSTSGQIFRQTTIEELEILGTTTRASIGTHCFQNCISLKKIKIESPVTSYGPSAFASNTAVEKIYINLSNTTSIEGTAFCFSTKYDAGNTTTQWYNQNGEKVVDLSSMETFSGKALASSNIGSAKIIWPTAIKSLGDETFRKCNITGVMYINAAEDVTLAMTRWAFDGNAPSVVICGEGVTTISNFFEAQCTVVCLADSVEFTQSDPFKKSDNTIYCKAYTANNAGNITSKATVTNITSGTVTTHMGCGAVVDLVLADSTPLKLNYVEHSHEATPDNTVCPAGSVTIYKCPGCGDTYKVTDEETYVSDTHEFDISDGATIVNIVYANNNYLLKGTITKKCAHCDANTTPDIEEESFAPLFDDLGYSMEESSSNVKSISQTVSVNIKALEFYESLMQVKINYGVVAAIANGEIAPLSVVDGKIVAGANAVSMDMTDTNYSKVVLIINGVSTSVAVNCSGYLMVDGVISYISGDELADKPAVLTYVDAAVPETPVEDEE